jgi:uncharacterized protein
MNTSGGWDLNERSGFLGAAGLVYGAIAAATAGLAWASGVRLVDLVIPGAAALAWGLLGVIPMVPVYFVAKGLRDLVVEHLGRPLSRCHIFDLVALAIIAGTVEELLFRGVLETWWSRSNPWVGMIAANLLFGLCHALTPTYFLIATAFGFYFSALAQIHSPRNLVLPIIAHIVYDLVGFLLIARLYRLRRNGNGDLTEPPRAECGE